MSSTRTPAIVGFLLAGAAILTVSFLVSSREGGEAGDVPPFTILAPSTGDTVANPVTIVFRTPGELRLDPSMGWSTKELHIHTMVGAREIMPAAADISPADSAWAWKLPALEPGTHRLWLTWAGRHHGNLPGVTDTITIHVR